MKLYIDTSNSEKILIHLNDEIIEKEAKRERSQALLSLIEETLAKKGKSSKEIQEIEVNLGPGSFTGLRVGVSVANALGWVLGVPVNGKDVKKDGPVEPIYSEYAK